MMIETFSRDAEWPPYPQRDWLAPVEFLHAAQRNGHHRCASSHEDVPDAALYFLELTFTRPQFAFREDPEHSTRRKHL